MGYRRHPPDQRRGRLGLARRSPSRRPRARGGDCSSHGEDSLSRSLAVRHPKRMTEANHPAPRPWGYWTEVKLEILGDYLNAFLTASQSQREVIYLDAFAGEGHG